jgi:serine/threonine protein kinase
MERVVGRYALLGELAAGGMATVHFGRLIGPVGFSRTVAIKRLHAQFAKDPEFVAMFLDEARLAARIQHPNVVSTLDVVALEGELLLVLEYVHGEALAHLLRAARKTKKPLPLKIVAAIVSGMLHGLHAAHEARSENGDPLGIVHRDMSPQNLLVGMDGTARVLDFGVAKAVGRVITTREGQLKGKVAYMSPEQVRSGVVDRRTDIYAASIVLWEVLAGRRLFDGDNEGLLLFQVSEGAKQRPGEIVPGVPPELDDIVMRGLAHDPKNRFATAWDMAVALEEAIGLASPRQVGAWVAEMAGDHLEKRARRVTELESISSDDFVPVSDPATSSRPRDSAILVEAPRDSMPGRVSSPPGSAPRAMAASLSSEPRGQVSSVSVPDDLALPITGLRPRWIAAIVVALGLAGALVVAFRSGDHGAATAIAAASAAPPAPAALASLSAPVPSAAPAPSVAAPTPTVSVAVAPSAPSAKPLWGPKIEKAPAGGCSPPYTLDAAGIRKLKPQCLRE